MNVKTVWYLPLFLSLLYFVACVPPQTIKYDVGLKEVVTPVKVKETYGAQKITPSDSAGIKRFIFENSMVQILWVPTTTEFDFVLYNKTDFSIKIMWDDAAYVDENGASNRVMHAGVKYTDRNTSQPPSVVPRKGKITDLVLPTNNVYFISGQYGGWSETPLFPGDNPNLYVGKTVQILLPLKIEDVVNEYTFIFDIKYIPKGK